MTLMWSAATLIASATVAGLIAVAPPPQGGVAAGQQPGRSGRPSRLCVGRRRWQRPA